MVWYGMVWYGMVWYCPSSSSSIDPWPGVEEFLVEFWEMLAYFGNTLIFVITGIIVVYDLGPGHVEAPRWRYRAYRRPGPSGATGGASAPPVSPADKQQDLVWATVKFYR